MKWKKYGPILWALALVSFIVATLEGIFYFARYSQYPLFRLLMTLENSCKAFVFAPTIKIGDVLAGLEGASPFQQAVGYAYGLAVFLAPLCTATALLLWAELAVRRLMNTRQRKGAHVLIFGWNENVRTLVSGEYTGSSGQYQLHVVTAAKLSEGDELWLFRNGTVPHRMDLLTASGSRREKLFRQLPLQRVRRVLLMEDSSVWNFSIYRTLSENSSLFKDAQYYCLCEDEAARSFIETACDELLMNGAEKRAEMTLFSLSELKADSIFSAVEGDDDSSMPLHTVNDPDRTDIHLLIAGFGTVGQEVLLQAINLGVLSSQNRLCVDVVDLDMDKKRDLFTNRFHTSVDAAPQEEELLVTAPTADGELRIRFHQTDVRGRGFSRLLERLNGDFPLTYAAICIEQVDIGMHCIVELKKLDGSFPIALRMENGPYAASYLKQDNGVFKEVFPIAVSDHMLRISNICHEKREQMARQFHRVYESIQLLPPGAEPSGQPPEGRPWTALKMYQRRANLLLYRHQAVKNIFGRLAPETRERCFGENGTILQRMGDGSYRCRYEGRAMADAINAEPEIRELGMTEHRRWCYVMAMQGWRWGEKKDEARRKTPYLTTWDVMCEEYPDVAIYDLMSYLMCGRDDLGKGH